MMSMPANLRFEGDAPRGAVGLCKRPATAVR